MGFLQKNQIRVNATRAFCEKLSGTPDPFAVELAHIASPDARIVWAIAGEALHQAVSYAGVAQLVAALRAVLPGEQLLQLPAPKEALIRKAMHSIAWTRDWVLEAHVYGILISIGEWGRRCGTSLSSHVQQRDTAQLWRELGNIYFMGRTSVVKPKVLCALHRLRMPEPLGLGITITDAPLRSGHPWPFPVSNGVRRWLKLLGPDPVRWMESHSEPDRLRYFQKMYAGIWPANPQGVAHGLSFFLEPCGVLPLCIQVIEGCPNCPLGQMNPMGGQCPGRRV